MPNQLEYEMRQSSMLRGVSLKIKRDYMYLIYKLYDEEFVGEGDYKESAGEWALIISDFFTTEDIEKYTILVEKARRNKINLWESASWKRHMRIQLPRQFRKRMVEYTQVPRLATMSVPTEEKKKIIDRWE